MKKIKNIDRGVFKLSWSADDYYGNSGGMMKNRRIEKITFTEKKRGIIELHFFSKISKNSTNKFESFKEDFYIDIEAKRLYDNIIKYSSDTEIDLISEFDGNLERHVQILKPQNEGAIRFINEITPFLKQIVCEDIKKRIIILGKELEKYEEKS